MNFTEEQVQEQLKLFFEDKPLTLPLRMLNKHANFAKRIELLNKDNERRAYLKKLRNSPKERERLLKYHRE